MKISTPFKHNNGLYNIKSPLFHKNLDIIKIPNLKTNNTNFHLLSKSRNKVTDFIIMKSLWNDLGVNIEYQKQFENNINEIKDELEKAEMVIHEKNHLKKFREILIKLSEEISNRDEIIYKLKKYCNELDKYTYDKNIYPEKINENENENEVLSSLFKSIYNNINLYRISTVNIVNRMTKVRELSSYYELNNKWDASNINRTYIFRKNYLISMCNDIEFINNSSLLDYIQTFNENDSPKVDLFLSNWNYLKTNNYIKYNLSISKELQREIIKSKYIILQDNLLNKIKKETKKLLKLKKNIFSQRSNPNHSVGNNYSRFSKKARSEVHLVNHETENKFYEIFGHNQVNLSRTLYYLKKTMGENYGNMFLSGNKIDSYNTPRNLDIMNNYFALNNNYNIISNENNEKEKLNATCNSRDISEKTELKKLEMINNLLSNESENNINISNNLKNSNDISKKNSKIFEKMKNNNIIKNIKSEYVIKKSEDLQINSNETNEKNKNIKKKNSKKKIKKVKEEDKNKEEKNNDINNKDMKIINTENIFIERKKVEEKENLIKAENPIKKFDEDKIKLDFVVDINIIKDNKKENEIINNNISEQNNKSEILNDNQKIINNENINEEINDKNEITNEQNEISKNFKETNGIKLENIEINKETIEINKENNEIKEENNNNISKENNEILISKESEQKEIKELEENKSKNYITISRNDSSENNSRPKIKLFQYREYSSDEQSKRNLEYDQFC